MLAIPLAILTLGSGLLSVHAQTVNAYTGQPIRASDGTCLWAYGSFNTAPVSFKPCDNSNAQKWDVSTGGQYITDSGFAIIILSGVCVFHPK